MTFNPVLADSIRPLIASIATEMRGASHVGHVTFLKGSPIIPVLSKLISEFLGISNFGKPVGMPLQSCLQDSPSDEGGRPWQTVTYQGTGWVHLDLAIL